MRKIWDFSEINFSARKVIAANMGISPILAQILINRGITDCVSAQAYLQCDINQLFSPFLLKGMRLAVQRIYQAFRGKERIIIYGDYDVDGLTSTALLFFVFSELGANVSYYIPHRVNEGYGLNAQFCDYALNQKISLLITVDCGIGAGDYVDKLNDAGIDTIITDHHRPLKQDIPEALSVIDPLQKGCSYPYKDLAGVGLAYKLAEAVSAGRVNIEQHLDLVALGTVSDVAPLTGENRVLVKHGLEVLSRTNKPGLKALLQVVGLSKKKLAASHIGFMLGPRLNAAGRIGDSKICMDLLLSDDYNYAYKIAQSLDQTNKDRQKIEAKTLRQALAMVESEVDVKKNSAIVLHNAAWHPGVIGIVASRLAERFYCPAILISTSGEIAKGSGRSIRRFHLFNALEKCGHLLETFGGHKKAAGLSILPENIDIFRQIFYDTANNMLTKNDMAPTIDVDLEIGLRALSEKLIFEIEKCAPFGRGNPRPVFVSRDLKFKSKPLPLGRNAVKVWLTDGKITCETIVNRSLSIKSYSSEQNISVAYSPTINNWQGISTIQLQLKDIVVGTQQF